MRIEILLDPQAEGYADFVRDLRNELAALPGADYRTEETPAPKDTLDVEHDILKFIFEHGDKSYTLLIVVLQIIRAVLDRRNQQGRGLVIKAGDKSLKYPTTPKAEKNFVDRLKNKPQAKGKSSGKTRKTVKKGNKRRGRR